MFDVMLFASPPLYCWSKLPPRVEGLPMTEPVMLLRSRFASSSLLMLLDLESWL